MIRSRIWRRAVAWQFAWSAAIDRRLVPATDCRDGFADFREQVVGPCLRPGLSVYDVGGGRSPFLPLADKRRLALRVTGLDVDASELAAAPPGAYDATIEADLTAFRGNGDGDIVIGHTVLEHVADARLALEGIASLVRSGGTILLFMPSANAAFARLNRLIPGRPKRWLLDSVWPEHHDHNGFFAYYDCCTPQQMTSCAEAAGLRVAAVFPYFLSYYFYACSPAHLVWRLGANLHRRQRGSEAAQYFSVVAHKP